MDSLGQSELTNERIKLKLEQDHLLEVKGLELVYEEIKQRLIAVSAKLQKCDYRSKQFRQNKLFWGKLKRFFKETGGATNNDISPNVEESLQF